MKNSLYIFSIIFVAGAVIAGFFLVLPRYRDFVTANAEIEMIEERIRERDNYLQDLKTIDKKLNDYQNELKLIDAALYSDPWLPHLYNYFIDLSIKRGIILNDIKGNVLAKETGSNFRRISLSIEGSGDYSSFKNFLTSIENSSRIFDVNNINLRIADDFNLAFSINLTTRSY
jgi:Tfp pilus assembly protein PilO